MAILKTGPFTQAADYSFTVIPLFILMGQFAFHSGLSEGLFGAADKWLGGFRGGLSMATIAACAGFAAICGSTAATAATMGVVALPEMRKYGYKDSLATGSIAAGGTLGILIPPSTSFIIYGIVATVSIGQLFAAGIVPGIILALCYITAIIIQMKIQPDLAPGTVKYSWKVRFASLKGTIGMVILFLAVIGGMFVGIFTANEAAAMGAFLSLCFMIIKKQFTIKRFIMCLEETIRTSSMVMLILVGAYVMGAFLAVTKMPMKLADFITGLGASPALILIAILILYVLLGCIMDSLAMVMLTVPIFCRLSRGRL
jgi:tripartite ATP-independent transporter DctM subunit